MNKPSNFILSTDYMSIAEYEKVTYSVSIPATTFDYGKAWTFNRTATSQQGAIDRIQVEINGATCPDSSPYFQISSGGSVFFGIISVYRTSATNIRTRVFIYGADGYNNNMPATTFNIRINSFKPPNQF